MGTGAPLGALFFKAKLKKQKLKVVVFFANLCDEPSALTLATHVLCGEIYLNRGTREHGTEEGKSRIEK